MCSSDLVTTTLARHFGTNFLTTPSHVTNRSTCDLFQPLKVYSTNSSYPGLTFYRGIYSSGFFTNHIANDVGSVTVAIGQGSGEVTIKDSIVFGDDYALRFNLPSESSTSSNRFLAQNCIFRARGTAVESWSYVSVFNSCVFETIEPSSTYGSAVSFSANDDSTNYFVGCTFDYGANNNQVGGCVLYLDSYSEFNACRFFNHTNSASDAAAVFVAEESAHSKFVNCTFSLNGGQLARSNEPERTYTNHIYFIDCTIDDGISTVVCTNGQSGTNHFKVFVQGGNLKPFHFSHPDLVTWISETNEVITVADISLNTYYTNKAKLRMISADVVMTPADDTETSSVELRIDQANDGTFETVKTAYIAGLPLISQAVVSTLEGILKPGARYIFTNISTGTAPTIQAGSTQIIDLR